MLFPSRRSAPLSLASLSLALLGFTLIVKALAAFWVNRRFGDLAREYSYVGYDFPEIWPIERKTVLMAFDNPKHFRLDAEDGAAEWASTVPGDGVVHLGPRKEPFSLSMFHQLRCLDIMRKETVQARSDGSGPNILGRHCLNYIRQMVTCRGDLELESFQFASHKNPINLHGVYECKDWEAVYREVEENQKQYQAWLTAKK